MQSEETRLRPILLEIQNRSRILFNNLPQQVNDVSSARKGANVMSVYKRGGIWWYKFNFQGVTIRESSGLTNKEAARGREQSRHTELREGRAGITQHLRVPMFSAAADVWLKAKAAEWAA